ncbi:carboxypeptidase-like regulatory domain-containing protein, partial [Halolamina salina]
AAPPDAVCTNEGTVIVELVDNGHFRVRGCPKVAADGRIDFREVGETSVSLQSGGVLVSSDLLVDGQQYHVTLATEDPEATYVVTANASEGRIELSNEYVTGAGDVTVELDGDTVLNAGFQPPEAVRGSVVDGNVSVEGDLPGGSIDRAVLDDGSSVRLLDNVTQESGTVSLPVTLSPNGSYSLVLLYGDGSSVFVEVGDGGSSPPASEGTATSEQTEGGLIQSLGGNNVLVGALLTLAVLLGVVVAMLWLTSDDDDDGAANGGATGSRELRVSVIDGYNDSQITGAVTVEATPQKQQTKEGYRLDTSGRTHEITGGTSRIEVPRKPVELEATYNGISTSRTVRLAESDGVQLRFGPVPQTLTVRDEDGEPIPGATVAIVSDGQTHVTRETDEAGRAHFDVSVDATGFEVAVEHDRFESASRHVADPSSFPDSITLAEKTGTLRVRTAIDGEATDAV